MIGLCHKCGFMGDSPTKDLEGPTEEEWAEMQVVYRDTVEQLDAAQLAQHTLVNQLREKEQLFHDLESKLDTMLQILMAQTDAKRLNVISKISKRNNPSKLLLSIRKANQNEL